MATFVQSKSTMTPLFGRFPHFGLLAGAHHKWLFFFFGHGAGGRYSFQQLRPACCSGSLRGVQCDSTRSTGSKAGKSRGQRSGQNKTLLPPSCVMSSLPTPHPAISAAILPLDSSLDTTATSRLSNTIARPARPAPFRCRFSATVQHWQVPPAHAVADTTFPAGPPANWHQHYRAWTRPLSPEPDQLRPRLLSPNPSRHPRTARPPRP